MNDVVERIVIFHFFLDPLDLSHFLLSFLLLLEKVYLKRMVHEQELFWRFCQNLGSHKLGLKADKPVPLTSENGVSNWVLFKSFFNVDSSVLDLSKLGEELLEVFVFDYLERDVFDEQVLS
mgnify:CR=1 FL=1